MSSAKITLVGLYNYLQKADIDLFSNLTLPDDIDTDTVIANILQKSSEFEVQYPDTEYMINSIKYWSSKWYWTFDKWVKAINIKYEPLNNYDRTEEWTDDNEHEDENNITSNRTLTDNSSVTGNQTENTTGSSDTEVTKSAYDSSDYQPYEKSETDTSDTNTVNNTTQSTSTRGDNYTEGHTSDGTYKNTHKGRMYGNIGVTTSQQMLNDELQVAYFNLYDRIAEIFINEYCIPVYI